MGIVGDNGTGKSTFIKMLMGLVQPDADDRYRRDGRFGYYSQDGLSFDDGAKVIDVVTEIAEHIELGEGRRLSASQFLRISCSRRRRSTIMSKNSAAANGDGCTSARC
ncbi:MAG: ATP-binding cassette domain-containing protein [Alistipes sp.]